MILTNDLIHDKEYWFCKLITSRRGDRVRERVKPSKVKFKLLKEPTYSYGSRRVGYIYNPNKGYELFSIYENDVKDNNKLVQLFDNEDDCIKYYNELVIGYLEELDALHARERSRIEKEFIKKKGE